MGNAFKLGQFRKTNLDSYMSPIDFSFEEIKTTGSYSEAVTFIDKGIFLNTSNLLVAKQSYYLNFTVHRLPDTDQIISVYLKNSTETENGDRQNLYTYTIKKGLYSNPVPIELIINPANSFDEIVFELQRTADDYSKQNKDGTHGRKMEIEINHLTRLYNVLDYIGIKPLAKIGIQGPPGLLMSINGEEIRIGRSGIYEMAYNMSVDFIGFVIKDNIQSMDGQDYFVMDYQY